MKYVVTLMLVGAVLLGAIGCRMMGFKLKAEIMSQKIEAEVGEVEIYCKERDTELNTMD